jgi:hypothetical protein
MLCNRAYLWPPLIEALSILFKISVKTMPVMAKISTPSGVTLGSAID